MHARRFGLVRVRSPLLAESLLFSVPAGTEMVHFPALSSSTYVFSRGYLRISRGGFPHSEISGSKPVCGSPKLIAAYHVLHRLLVPRHPPYALSSLTSTLENKCGQCFAPIQPMPITDASEFSGTPSVFVVGKNYRLQDIQLSKTKWRIPGSNR